MAPYDPIQFGILLAAYAALVPLALVAGVRSGTALFAVDRDEALAIAAACLGALFLRVWLVEPTIFHENGHGYRYIGMAIRPTSDLHVYGSGWQAFFHLLYRLAPPVTGSTLYANTVIGSLTCLFAGLHNARTFGRGTGIATAAVLAVLPIHIRMSATESPFVLAMFLAVLALWAVRELRERPSIELALLAGIAAAIAGQIRPLLAVIPPFVLLYAIACAPGRREFVRTRYLPILISIVLALTVGHMKWLYDLHLASGPSHYASLVDLSPQRVWHALGSTALIINPAATPPLLLLLGLVGLFVGARHSLASALMLAVAFCASVYAYAVRSEYTSEAIRFMMPATVFLALLAGPGLAALIALVARARSSTAIPIGLSAFVLATSLLSDHAFTPTADAFEYALLRHAMARLPKGCRIVKPPDRAANGRVEARLPDYELAHHMGTPPDGGPLVVGMDRHTAGRGCEIYWRGLACGLFAHDEPAAAIRPECAAFESGRRLRPIFTRWLDGSELTPHRFVYATEPAELGFFALESDAIR